MAGLSSEWHNVLWFTDEDEIAANQERLTHLTNLVAWVGSMYLPFSLGHLRCGTTQSDDGSMRIEDLAAVPDMIAGAISEQMRLNKQVGPDIPNVFWMHRGDFTSKTSNITRWLTDVRKPLKRVFCLVDSVTDSNDLSVSWFHFHNQCYMKIIPG